MTYIIVVVIGSQGFVMAELRSCHRYITGLEDNSGVKGFVFNKGLLVLFNHIHSILVMIPDFVCMLSC